MRKLRGIAALLALLLLAGLCCPPALADGPPEPTGNVEPSAAPAPDGGVPPAEPAPEPGPSEPPPQAQEPTPGPDAPEPTPPPTPEPPSDALSPEPPSNALPPEDPPGGPVDGCDTVEELVEQIAQGGGGTITVTGDLALNENDNVWLEAEAPVTVDLGPHGITVPAGATLALNGPVTLTGTGAPAPLLTVSGFLTTLDGAAVRAAGEDAVAVRLTGGRWNTNRASVEAAGANACAVEAEGLERLDLYRVQLTARGENALCVRADASVHLILCRAESEGTLADVRALTLDGTAASPEPPGARIVRRTAVPHDHYETSGLWIEAGASREALDGLLETHLYGAAFEYGLLDVAQEEAVDLLHVTAMTWTGGPVDLDAPGVYWFTGVPEDWDLGSVEAPEKRVPVHVADPLRPAIWDAYSTGGGVRLSFFRPIREAERVKLWYSADLGRTWLDAGALPEAEIGAEGAVLPALPEANRDYLFRLEVEGGPMAGASNTLRCLFYDNQWGWGGGGDWDGGDWGDQGELPDDNVEPPPDREPEGDPSPEPDREDGGDGPDDEPDDRPEERPERPDPPAAPPPGVEVTFVDPAPALTPDPTPTPAPTPAPEETVPPAETAPPASAPPEVPPTVPAATPAPASQPPSSAPVTAEPAPPALPEGATASLTGRDLEAQKLANPAGVTLAADGLKATFPYALTDALGLGSDGVLSVLLAQSGPDRFEVRVWADGREVADFGGGVFTVAVPVEGAEGTSYRCAAPDGREIAASASTETQAEFELTSTGLYTLSAAAPAPSPAPEESAAPETPAAPTEPEAKPAPLALLALGIGALAAAGGALLWRRRGGR